jgi:hypothetical protein
MKYFTNPSKTAKIIYHAVEYYKEEHDKFHINSIKYVNYKENDELFTFLIRLVMVDIQSRPINLTKHDVLLICEEIIKNKRKLLKNCFTNKDPNTIVEEICHFIDDIKQIGPKIAFLITKNIFLYGNTLKYFGKDRKVFYQFLKEPVDVHVRNLLCYRFKLINKKHYNKIEPQNQEFQEELLSICKDWNNSNHKKIYPIDLDIFWYIGFNNCNKRIYCDLCKMKKYCEDQNFISESEEKLTTNSRKIRKQIKAIPKMADDFSKKVNLN